MGTVNLSLYPGAASPCGSAGPTRSISTPCLTRQGSQLRAQVQRAALVQRSLLPDIDRPLGECRLASIYWPCEMLGGDLYDIVRRDDSGVVLRG